MSYILFDVGANWGVDSLGKTGGDGNIITYAFEPTPYHLDHLRANSASFADRYNIYPFAVSDFDGTANFKIVFDHNGGCNSLNTFSEGLDKTWPGRPDFHVKEEMPVRVIRLDTWFKENNINIDRIDYFHCDTQGSDLRVLQGMGEYLQLIEYGVIECSSGESVKLYKENHTLAQAIEWLDGQGYVVDHIESGDGWNNEVNLHFRKRRA
jgi:FkbM family methyltransferase